MPTAGSMDRLEPREPVPPPAPDNTRFALLTKQCRNLASSAQMLNRLSDDWQTHIGYC